MMSGKKAVSRPLFMATASAFVLAAAMGQGVAQAQDSEGTVEEIVVTGSRIVRSGFTAPTPVTVVGADRIEKLGVTNVGDALANLPAFRNTAGPNTSNIQPANAGFRQADLRGIQPQRTLVLVDGHRFVPTTQQGTIDLNLIPTLLLQRAEVVTGGASAQYGSDAVAGVVNLILNRRFEGVSGQIQYGQTQRGDGRNYQASLALGRGFAEGRGHIVVAGEMERSDGLGSCYTRDWCAQEYQNVTNNGGLAGFPFNNIVPRSHNVTAVVGGLITSGPLAGTAFNPDGTTRAFQYGQRLPGNSTFMIGGEGDNGFIGAPLLVVPVQRHVAYSHGEYDFTPNIKGFVDLSYGHVKATGRGAQTRDTGNIAIRGDNAFLSTALRNQLTAAGVNLQPGVTAFNLGRMGDDLGYTYNRTTTNVYRAMFGLEGKFLDNWSWNLTYQYGRNNYYQEAKNNRLTQNFNRAVDAVVDPASGAIVCRDTLSTNATTRAAAQGCQPLNLFGVNRYSTGAQSYAFGNAYLNSVYTQHVVDGSIQGDVFNTWAGPVSVSAGFEHRASTINSVPDPISASTPGVNNFYVFNPSATSGDINVTEGYFETVVPLAKDMTLAKNLEFNGAVRRTHYNTTGDVTTWKVGGSYEPVDWLRFRLTRSRDIRAPNYAELYGPITSGSTTVNGQLATQQSGGNPNLQNEIGDTLTAGFAFRPSGGALEGFRVSVDAYRIKLKGAIAQFGGQNIADRCRAALLGNAANSAYCQLITYTTAPTATSLGVVNTVRNLFLNLNQLETSGVDIEADYVLPLSKFGTSGSLTFRALATYLRTLKTTDATGNTIDRAGQLGAPPSGATGLPRWQLNGLVTYDRGPLSMTVETRYISGGLYDVTFIGPDQAGYSPTLANSINNNNVKSTVLVNLNAQYDLPDWAGSKVQVFGGINNLFDKDPVVNPSNQGSGNMAFSDPFGRAFKLGFRLRQ
jgi:outer membrane receptor protein involved in Fe transport